MLQVQSPIIIWPKFYPLHRYSLLVFVADLTSCDKQIKPFWIVLTQQNPGCPPIQGCCQVLCESPSRVLSRLSVTTFLMCPLTHLKSVSIHGFVCSVTVKMPWHCTSLEHGIWRRPKSMLVGHTFGTSIKQLFYSFEVRAVSLVDTF